MGPEKYIKGLKNPQKYWKNNGIYTFKSNFFFVQVQSAQTPTITNAFEAAVKFMPTPPAFSDKSITYAMELEDIEHMKVFDSLIGLHFRSVEKQTSNRNDHTN